MRSNLLGWWTASAAVVLLFGCTQTVGHSADGSIDVQFPDGGLMDGAPMDGTADGGDAAPPASECGSPGCGWCASKGECIPSADDCAFEGVVGGELCWDRFDPCTVASCWEPEMSVPACGTRVVQEDFSSGRFSVHRYAATLPGGEPVTITLNRTAGLFEPALFVADRNGALLYAGDLATLRADVQVLASERTDTSASVTLQMTDALMVSLLVTDQPSVDSGFVLPVSTDAQYELVASQECEGGSASESVGSPNSGSLENGVRLSNGDGYVVADTGRNAEYGTQETVDLIRAGFAAVRARHPAAATVQVRDISIEGGGRPSGSWPHSSHLSGRDADITYHLDSCPETGCPSSVVVLSEFDAEATWTLFEYWLAQDAATYIFVDTALQQVLYDVAGRRGATAEQLDRWFQFPSTARRGVIRHEDGHRDHHHVRFRCPVDDSRCVE